MESSKQLYLCGRLTNYFALSTLMGLQVYTCYKSLTTLVIYIYAFGSSSSTALTSDVIVLLIVGSNSVEVIISSFLFSTPFAVRDAAAARGGHHAAAHAGPDLALRREDGGPLPPHALRGVPQFFPDSSHLSASYCPQVRKV